VTAGDRGDAWRVIDDLVTVKGKIFVTRDSAFLADILRHAHGTGHEGTEKTWHRLRLDFHVPNARAVVHNFVRSCLTCQKNKTQQLKPAGLLQPLEVPTMVWANIALDFIEGLPKVHGKSVILTVVDRFSKRRTSFPSVTRTQLRLWLAPSSTRSSSYMASRTPSSTTGPGVHGTLLAQALHHG
jgi:hypothetical protein